MWSWILALCGITGTFIVGTKNKLGWVVLFFNETLWIVYATQTDQYGFYLGSVAYMAVYIKNHRSWAKAERAVVELHRPQEITLPNGEWGNNCRLCDGWEYPCPTIQAIEKELG